MASKPELKFLNIYSVDGLHKRHPFLHNYPEQEEVREQTKHNHFDRKLRHLLPRGTAGLRLCKLHRHGCLTYWMSSHKPMSKHDRRRLRQLNKYKRTLKHVTGVTTKVVDMSIVLVN